ncbi:MAG: hypothetical protein LBS73_05075 [Campylobacteraceae bacterium]|jgi:hypothetical protein|nr:hypothetical protein [Campylobacteraceae bacterium]
MKNIFKILTALFAVVFLASCGDGGGSSSEDSFPTIETSFPPFNETPNTTMRTITYWNVAQADATSFINRILQKSFQATSPSNYNHDNLIHNGILYTAFAHVYNTPRNGFQIGATIHNSYGDIDANLLNEIYGNINGDIFSTTLVKSFVDDKTTACNNYATELVDNWGFTCTGTSCTKITNNYIFGWDAVLGKSISWDIHTK